MTGKGNYVSLCDICHGFLTPHRTSCWVSAPYSISHREKETTGVSLRTQMYGKDMTKKVNEHED